MEKKLEFGDVLSYAFTNGLKNFLSLIACYLLWMLTIWIPYLNVGTTIAMVTLPAALSKGKMINPLEIFDGKYRKFMGEYFLVVSLGMLIIFIATLFMIIPGIVMGIAYCLAPLLVVDKGKGATEALKLSNTITHGNKWTIFLVWIVLAIPYIILGWIWTPLAIIYLILLTPISLCAMASIYGQLAGDIEEG
ncbi:DUF975 family protein [Natronoflexus pectinivorans]|uniref:Uncharacterized protein DUF975 n=1 Tax=Natronoflexus pectinivorans TaxID=682526 RepID=A0A4R2GL16_9BACT|nr:DUF975 family protein [Natronoflexus pectinivorans]TCO09583.1 uncharacterized protein DUF975 [Natronoflexus pectinivorans]